MVKVSFLVVLLFLIAPLGSWIVGRILLPQMGLTVPSFAAFFWASFFTILFGIVTSVIGYLIKRT